MVLPKSPFAMAHPVAMPVAAHGLPAVPSHFSRSLLFICLSLHVPPLGIGRHLLVFRLCLHVPPLGRPATFVGLPTVPPCAAFSSPLTIGGQLSARVSASVLLRH